MEHHVHNCCHKRKVKRGLWSIEEDQKLIEYIKNNGYKNWSLVPTYAGLQRCGKSCRLRWLNYLRPDVKLGNFTEDETKHIMRLHKILGNKWAKIAKYLPGRTDNEVKNYWNTIIKKRLMRKKKTENFGNTSTTSIVVPHVAPSATPMSVGGTMVGSENNNNNNKFFSYPPSSFSFTPNLISFSNTITSPRPPPPPPSDNLNTLLREFGSFSHPLPLPQSDNLNTLLRGFGPFPNSSINNHEMNFNAQVSIPEVAIPSPSIVETPPLVKSTWASNNNNYLLNFNQVTHEENYAPFTFPDMTTGGSSSVYRPILDDNFPSFPPMNYQDSSLLMTTNPAIMNNKNVTIALTSDDDGIELLESMMSPYVPGSSTPSSTSPFLEERRAYPNASLCSFNHDEPIFNLVYPLF